MFNLQLSSGSHIPGPERVCWKSPAELEYAICHVFLPADHNGPTIPHDVVEDNVSLAHAVCVAAHTYNDVIENTFKPKWCRTTKMLDKLQAFLWLGRLTLGEIVFQLCKMETGDTLVFLNGVQDAAVIFTKQDHCTLYQPFLRPQHSESVYPEWAIEIPDEEFHNRHFQSELAHLLLNLDEFHQLLTSILRGVGRSAEVAPHSIKCICSHYKLQFWDRSLLWLLIKVVIRTTLCQHDGLGRICYKVFMLHLMCKLAIDAMETSLSSHLLHAVSCKILRRLGKLGSSAPNWLYDMVLKTNVSLRETLEARWKAVKGARFQLPSWKPSQLDLDRDTWVSILRSKEHTSDSLTNHGPQFSRPPFFPKLLPRDSLSDFLSLNGSSFEEAYSVDPYIALYNLEQAVEQGIDDWFACVTDVDQACVQVEVLMDKYLSRARVAYMGNPDHLSIMLLTGIELWIVLDKLVVGVAPMLTGYSPGIRMELLQIPLFGKIMPLRRLHGAYEYLSTRCSHPPPRKVVLSHTSAKNRFAVRYDVDYPERDHIVNYERTIASHKITAVFEVHDRVPLRAWCIGTVHLLNTFPSHSIHAILPADPSLPQPCLVKRWVSPFTNQVYLICYGPEKTSLDPHTLVCTQRSQLDDKCFSWRPTNRGLDQYINATSHTSNGVLAAQAECPDDLSLREFIAFGHLRSGGSLQWLNILPELRSRTLNFRCQDVYFLLAKATLQVGPFDFDTNGWKWHLELRESSFCYSILDEIESLLVDVALHSQDGVMMGILTLLLTRLLASSPCENVSERVIGLLQCIRRKTFYWVQELSYDVMIAPTNIERQELLRDMATTCRSTFDVDLNIVHKLVRSAEDVSALLFCAIVMRANRPIDLKNISDYSRLLLERDHRLSLGLENVLREVIEADASNQGIDLAVCTIWPGYRPGPRAWEALPRPNSHWLTCETAATQSRRSQVVHLNLLDGALLVDGKPIDGLPDEIRKKTTFRRIFGDQRFLVIASDLPGMDFSSLAMVWEHRVHFALRGDNLVIWAQHKDMHDILEVIPQQKLDGDLPERLVYGHVHWLNRTTSKIEIRPHKQRWEESSENWRTDNRSGQYRVYKGAEWLVDIRSRTYDMISSRLKCLDGSQSLIVTTIPTDTQQTLSIRRLYVVLPRYGLSFFINDDGELESCDFKNMIYDENQSIGTLFGLENLLVLRPRIRLPKELVHRCVIIPDGRISRKQLGQHVQVTIDPLVPLAAKNVSTLRITYYTYSVDTDLGCLVGDGTWRSRVYLALLYAQTSINWMPDPLTGRTGIQEALCLLQSAGCRSTMELDTCHGELELLSSIDNRMYPQLQFAMEEIAYRIERERFLCGSKSDPPTQPKLDVLLALRVAHLFPLEVVGPVPVPMPYPSKRSDFEDLAHIVSLAVYHWLIKAEDWSEPQGDTELTNISCANFNGVRVPPSIAEADTFLRTCMFREGGTFLKKSPPSIASMGEFLQEATEASHRFRLLFLLPVVVRCIEHRHRESAFLSILVALAKQFPLRNPPRYDQCSPESGWTSNHSWSYPAEINYMLKKDLTSRLRVAAHRVLSNPLQSLRQSSELPFQVRNLQVTLYQLLRDRSPPETPAPSQLERCNPKGSFGPLADSGNTATLSQLFSSLRMNGKEFQRQYITRLHVSSQCAREASRLPRKATGGPSIEKLQKHYMQCKDGYAAAFITLRKELGPSDPLEQALHTSGQWPQITPHTLLRCLTSTSPFRLSDGWKKCLVSLAVLLVQLQRSRRLLRFALDGLDEEMLSEMENEGCDGWNPEDYPDWLLTQVQGNFIIRGIQADVAINMISQPFGENITMQVNMGEGKSSVILPICAVTLADGKQLVRVIVPKPLTVQTFRLLVHRLGELVNRPIYYLPFARSLAGSYSAKQVETLRELLSECMHDRGILIAQPDHVLSFKLASVKQQLPKNLYADSQNPYIGSSGTLLELQRWIHFHARDILDESDDMLHPRFQLMYTIGPQQHMEGSPDRWTITQQVFRIVRKYALSLSHDLPDAIEYSRNTSGSFPCIRILRLSDAGQRLISLIARDVMNGCLPTFKFRDIYCDRRLRAAIRDFISSKNVLRLKANIVEEYGRRTGLWDGLLLLRGLLACNVLLFALAERRWRVDYGLAPTRTKLAVPYRAKDVPAPRAEFGHPDITIVLTCLSYYYGGLTEEQLRTAFEILQAQDDPTMEYANWLRDYKPGSVPELIQDLSNVKVKSSEQWDKYIFPLFARNQGAVDFYLSRVVFPKEAREFPWKLAASSWDLAEIRTRPTTGLSGTNDGHYLLPTSITQRDLDHQQGSNAMVLRHLLQPDNNSYMLISHRNGERRTVPELLKIVLGQEPKIRVLLDVGAQILDLSNFQLAETWLDLSSHCDAAVYFNENDELMALTKDGVSRPLLSSPFAQRLERCVIYLDDAHTRGTDLKLPHGSRAAVTLGPNVTKDRLVQGCMRMRKLGHGHSVMFLAPLEVDRSIRAVTSKDDEAIPVTTTDILHWTIRETWTNIQRWAPYWAQQGINHNTRYDTWTHFCSGELTQEDLASAWLKPEPKSLADLYAPFPHENASSWSSDLDFLPDIQQHCEDLGVLQLPESRMEEEQEKEVNREIEREREVQKRPLKANPAKHSLHPAVVAFVRTGVIPALYIGTVFHPISTALEGSSVAAEEAHAWSPFILVTSDFCTAVDPVSYQGRMDSYLRPVQWVLSGKLDIHQVLVLLSPFEADCLIPDVRISKHVHLHVYTPRTSERMKPADDLMLYSIPPVPDIWTPPWDLVDQLNVFSGQLYLTDYESYLRLCCFMRIESQNQAVDTQTPVQHNQMNPGVLKKVGNTNTYTDSSLCSVTKLLAIRRSGLSFAETHMGRILQGEQLTGKDFKIMTWAKSVPNTITHDVHMLTRETTEQDVLGSSLSRSSKQVLETTDSSDGDSRQHVSGKASSKWSPMTSSLSIRGQVGSKWSPMTPSFWTPE